MSDTPLCDNAIIVYSNGVAAHFPAGCLIVSLDFARTLERSLTAAKAKLAMAEKTLEKCPWPEDVWVMTKDQYVATVPDDGLRTAISGLLMRMGWKLAQEAVLQSLRAP